MSSGTLSRVVAALGVVVVVGLLGAALASRSTDAAPVSATAARGAATGVVVLGGRPMR